MTHDYRVQCCPRHLAPGRRNQVKVIDCTVRDGGLMNNWSFDHELVKKTFRALMHVGVDIMEVGYRSSSKVFDPDKYGPWRFCWEDDLAQVVERGDMQLATMVDIGKVEKKDIPHTSDTLIDVVRIATYAHQIEECREIIDHCLECGYDVFLNLMAVSAITEKEMDDFLEAVAKTPVQHVTLVDSFGALYPYHVRYLVIKYREYLGDRTLGIHAHNSQQNAFANTIEAINMGVEYADATVHGIGRGSGNTQLELLLFYLNNPRYDVEPLLDLIEDYGYLRDDLRWGYHLPYVITGYLNEHPRSAMALMDTDDRYKVFDFYRRLKGNKPEGWGTRGATGKE
jgi:4-hydroxy 2-oxovalerate aldolase